MGPHRTRLQTLEDTRSDRSVEGKQMLCLQVRPLLPTKTGRVWRKYLCRVSGSGESTKEMLVKAGV